MNDRRRAETDHQSRPVLLTEPISQEPSEGVVFDFFQQWRADINLAMRDIPHAITFPDGTLDKTPAFCTTCGGFLYWRMREQEWSHVRDMREEDKG